MKQKVLSLLLTGAMVASMLAGCGTAAPEETSTKGEAGTKEETSAGDLAETGEDGYFTDEKGNTFFTDSDGTVYYVDMDGTKYKKFDDVELNYFSLQLNLDKYSEDMQRNNAVAAAIRDKIGVTVIFDSTDIEPSEKMNMMIATDDMPEMIMSYYGNGSDDRTMAVRKAIDEGMLYDITDLVPQYENIKGAWEKGPISEGWVMAELDRAENEGRRYVIPIGLNSTSKEIDPSSACVCVRGDVAEALGVDPASIKTADQLFDFMMAAKEYGFKDVNGNDCIVAGAMEMGWAFEYLFFNKQAKKVSEFTLDEDGKIVYDPFTQPWIDKYMFIWKLYNNDLMDVECLKQNEATADQKVGNGTYLFASSAYSTCLNRQKKSGLYYEHPEMRYVPVGPMDWCNGDPATDLMVEGEANPWCVMFSANATEEQVEAGLTYLNFMSSKEGVILDEYGFEGETFEYNEEGQPRMNKKWADECLANGSEETKKKLAEEYGMEYIGVLVLRHNVEWFGEFNRWSSLTQTEVDKYCSNRPAELVPGISADSFAVMYENYGDLAANCLDVNKKRDYIYRAFFAPTEEEALQILKDYQNFLATYNNGELQLMLDSMAENMEGKNVAW